MPARVLRGYGPGSCTATPQYPKRYQDLAIRCRAGLSETKPLTQVEKKPTAPEGDGREAKIQHSSDAGCAHAYPAWRRYVYPTIRLNRQLATHTLERASSAISAHGLALWGTAEGCRGAFAAHFLSCKYDSIGDRLRVDAHDFHQTLAHSGLESPIWLGCASLHKQFPHFTTQQNIGGVVTRVPVLSIDGNLTAVIHRFSAIIQSAINK